MLSIIIPAYNEEAVIADCLHSLLQQSCSSPVEVLICANGCQDNTVQICDSYVAAFQLKGYELRVLELQTGNKNKALNFADSQARYGSRLYLDADIICDAGLVEQAIELLDTSEPVYVSGALSIKPGRSFISNAYGKIWGETPYIRKNVTGIGCYGVNEAGRKYWGEFPMIHSDDKFVRLLFTTGQRVQTRAGYYWPVPQGLLTLIQVRIRWIKGNRQLKSHFPELSLKEGGRLKIDRKFLKTALLHPVSSMVFIFVYGVSALIATASTHGADISWSRAR